MSRWQDGRVPQSEAGSKAMTEIIQRACGFVHNNNDFTWWRQKHNILAFLVTRWHQVAYESYIRHPAVRNHGRGILLFEDKQTEGQR